MDGFITFAILVGFGIYIYRLINDVKSLKFKLFDISSQLSILEAKISQSMAWPVQQTPEEVDRPFEPSDAPVSPTSPEDMVQEEPLDEKPETIAPSGESPAYATPDVPHTAPAQESTSLESVEKDLSTRWMMWVGGIAFALGGAFLVKYSIDAGLLSPVVRVTLGSIIGLVMVGLGESLRLKRQNITWLDGAPDYLPSAISAAGLFTAFAAIYAAYSLYELIPPLVAFIALAALSFLASALALVQGRFFAYIGLIGGLVIPALVSTGNPSAYKLFPYLLVIVTSGLWVSRKRGWVDVPAAALFFGVFWGFIWISLNWHSGDIIPLGAYLLILGGINSILLRGATPSRAEENSLRGLMPAHPVTLISDLVMLLCVVLFVSIIRLEHYNNVAMFIGALWVMAHSYAVSKNAENDAGGLISIFGIVFLIITWHVPDLFEIQQMLGENEALYFALSPIAPPGLEKFVGTSVILAGAVSISTYLWLPNLLRKTMWASVGTALPIILLVINYWRIQNLETSIPFAFIAMILAACFTLAAIRINRSDISSRNELLATYAAGATFAVALAISMVLRDAWLSFALALEVVALGYIWQQTKVNGLRTLALLIASIVLIRLFFNLDIFDYGGGEALPVINWLFYAYGLSAACFFYAGRLFKTEQRDMLLSILTAGSVMLLITFITLEIHVLSTSHGTLLAEPTELEMALQTINWGAATTLLFWLELKYNDKILGYLRRFMTIVALIGLIVGGGVANNVYVNRLASDVMPIFNTQFLQYLIPAMLYAAKTWIAHTGGRSRSLKYYGLIAFSILWYWITAEVHVLSTMLDGFQSISDWERYGYSIAWLVYAVALLVVGLKKSLGKVRMAGLFVLAIVILKVFLVDMNELEGLARALSFMGLGAALIGIGYLYQKLNQTASQENIQESAE